MEPCQLGSGGVKDFLRDLILRGEDVLGKMIYKLTLTDISIGEMVAMINSLFSFVSQWEESLKDISMEMLNNVPAVSPKQVKSTSAMDDRKIMEQVSQLVRATDSGVQTERPLANQEESTPVFVYLDQSLKQYTPGSTGRCIISWIDPMRRFFSMVDLDRSDCKTLFAAMQNMHCDRMGQLPPCGEVFGVILEGSVYRAVRNKPTEHSPLKRIYLYLLDTGETVPYEPGMTLCRLSKYYRDVPALAINCRLVDEQDDAIDDDIHQYLESIDRTIQDYSVVSVEKSILFVRLSQFATRKSNVKNLSQKKCLSNQVEEVTTTVAKPMTPGKSYCPHHGSPECSKGAHPKTPQPSPKTTSDIDMIVPPIGSKVMLIPKFIRDVQHIWCQLVLANDVIVEIDLKEMELLMNISRNSMKYKKIRGRPEVAQKVFAKYKGTRWYRAEVVRYFDERKVLVFYVDHGHADMIPMDDIRQWDDCFNYLPYQAVLCRLVNVKPKKHFHQQAVIEMNRKLLNNRYWGTIVGNGNPLEIILYDDDGFDISNGLVIAGLAMRIEGEADSTGGHVGA